MMKVAKITALICGVLITLLFFSLLIMVTRPAILTGVSGGELARSLAGGNGASDGGFCRKAPDDSWICGVHGPDANGSFRVDVDWMGCWTATPRWSSAGAGQTAEAKGCIQLGDKFTFD